MTWRLTGFHVWRPKVHRTESAVQAFEPVLTAHQGLVGDVCLWKQVVLEVLRLENSLKRRMTEIQHACNLQDMRKNTASGLGLKIWGFWQIQNEDPLALAQMPDFFKIWLFCVFILQPVIIPYKKRTEMEFKSSFSLYSQTQLSTSKATKCCK